MYGFRETYYRGFPIRGLCNLALGSRVELICQNKSHQVVEKIRQRPETDKTIPILGLKDWRTFCYPSGIGESTTSEEGGE